MKDTLKLLAVIISLYFYFGSISYLRAQEISTNEVDISLDSLLSIPVNTATKSWQKTKETPASVTIITDKDIVRFGYRTLEDVLRNVRSFYVSNDRNYTYIGVRGFSRPTDYNNRILLLLNGQTMNENIYGSAPLGNDFPISPDYILRIEIVRGPSSVMYGTGAVFATINVVTKSGSALNKLQVSGEYGSFGQKAASVQYGNVLSGIDFSIGTYYGNFTGQKLFFKDFEGDSISHGFSDKLADAEQMYSIAATAKYKNWSFQIFKSHREKHVPTGAWGTEFNDERHKTIDNYMNTQLHYLHDFSPDLSLVNRLYYQQYYYEGAYPYSSYVSEESTVNYALGGESLLKWDVSASNRFNIGVEYRTNLRAEMEFMPSDSMILKVNSPFQMFSAFLSNEYQITTDLSSTIGFRYDTYSTGTNAITPRMALVYNPTEKTTLKLLYGSAFRTPNLYEISYYDVQTGTKISSNLQPERCRTFEFVAEQQLSEEFYLVSSLYRFSTINLIDVEIDGTDSMSQFRNSASNIAYGAELEATIRLSNGLRSYASICYQRVRNSYDSLLTNSPEAVFKCGIAFQIASYLSVSLDGLFETSRITVKYDDKDHAVATEPFALVNLTINSLPLWNGLSFTAQVRNLLNSSYSYPGGIEHDNAMIEQDKRNFWLKVSLEL
ncbi:MAG: TonB-dependent receptor [Ignavibacteria bacterium]|nr:TonB-dependent receptor [Ignavibacteria bacterium]